MMTIVLVAVGVAVLAGVAQTASGFGYALVSVPLLATATDPLTAVFATTAVGGVLCTFIAVRERRQIATAMACRLTLSSLVGMPLGILVSRQLDADALAIVIGLVLLVAVAVMMAGPRLPANRTVQVGAGAVSGTLLTSTGLSGPPLVLALDGAGMPPRSLRATLQSIFGVQAVIAVAAFVALGRLNDTVVVVVIASLMSLPLGWFIGERIFGRLSAGQFVLIVRLLIAASAVAAIVGALWP